MSAARAPGGGGWFGQNFDKLAIVVALLILIGSSVFLVVSVTKYRTDLKNAPWEKSAGTPSAAEKMDMGSYEKSLASLAKPFQVVSARQRMLTGDLRVSCVNDGKPIPYDATVCPYCRAPQPEIRDPEKFDGDGDGLPDAYETKVGLNPVDPSDAVLDSDLDQFTNLEEYSTGTDPMDPKIYPSPIAKVRLVRTFVRPFKLRFLGVSSLGADTEVYQLNLRSLERTYFAKMNDEVEGYVVTAYDANAPEGPTITLKQGDQSMPLVKGKVINQDARSAQMVSLLDKTLYRVQIGDEIMVKEHKYNVVDIKDDRVLIRDEVSGESATVGLLSAEEKSRLQGGDQTGAASPDASMQDAAPAAPTQGFDF